MFVCIQYLLFFFIVYFLLDTKDELYRHCRLFAKLIYFLSLIVYTHTRQFLLVLVVDWTRWINTPIEEAWSNGKTRRNTRNKAMCLFL